MEGDLTLGGGHRVQYTDLVSQKCTLETYLIALTNVTPINLIEKEKEKSIVTTTITHAFYLDAVF